MSKHTSRFRAGNDHASLYTEITNKIIANWKPAVSPGSSLGDGSDQGAARHAAQRRHAVRGYSGINVLILWGRHVGASRGLSNDAPLSTAWEASHSGGRRGFNRDVPAQLQLKER
jgi:antirestriction protein ArdC